MEQNFLILVHLFGNVKEQFFFIYLKQVHFLGTFHGTFPILTLVAGLNLIYLLKKRGSVIYLFLR
jgi:hypothetical protein